jgi:hypothetical protein
VYANGYLASDTQDDTIIEEDWTTMDQTQSSYSQDSTFDHEYIEEIAND